MALALYCILNGMSGLDNKGGTFLIQSVSFGFLIHMCHTQLNHASMKLSSHMVLKQKLLKQAALFI